MSTPEAAPVRVLDEKQARKRLDIIDLHKCKAIREERRQRLVFAIQACVR
jgi:hypothetical protein